MAISTTKHIDNTLEIRYKGKFFKRGDFVYKVYQIRLEKVNCLYIYPKGEFGWMTFTLKDIYHDEEITKEEFMKSYVRLLINLDELTTRI